MCLVGVVADMPRLGLVGSTCWSAGPPRTGDEEEEFEMRAGGGIETGVGAGLVLKALTGDEEERDPLLL